ncbi:esterase B1-like [Drosophila montana]|uniref:esterase B1-like n=1 Tax=Drosophila montana TaxID=40370 RepID=UPI00313BE709
MNVKVCATERFRLATKSIAHRMVQYNLATDIETVLDTEYGRVRGLQRKTLYDEELYFAFEGIPYAKPPLGELRFRAPQPPETWTHILDCTYPRSKPMHRHLVLRSIEGSEDCLYLNVYSKSLKSENPLPVMVWIYGGGFQIGEATRDVHSPDYFMQKEVILVTLNYRLGALGFLSLSDPDLDVPGNAGLKDQVMALRWIHKNIANFNGDPNNITLMGISAGAASTQIMMSTEQTRGLFHKAILMSGSSLCEWIDETQYAKPYWLACKLGYEGDENDQEIFRFLQSIPAKDISGCRRLIMKEDKRDYVLIPFGPVVEPYVSESCVISMPPCQSLSHAWGNKLPVIIGGTSFEGLVFYQHITGDMEYMLSAFEALIPREVRFSCTPAEIQAHVRRLKISYFDDATREHMEFKECLHLLSCKHFWHAIHRTVLARLAYASSAPTYLYRFDFDSHSFNYARIMVCGRNERGVCHADDFLYLFYCIPSYKLEKTSFEYRTIERMIGMWTAFAAHDDPNCEILKPATWEALKSHGTPMCLNIGTNLQFIELPESKELHLWDSFYKKLKLY